MSNLITEYNRVQLQYSDSKNLQIRKNFHQNYSKNKFGFANWVFCNIEFKENYKILELGCGTGDFWDNRIKDLPHNCNLFLSDISKSMVSTASEKFNYHPNITVLSMDANKIPFADNQFDIVIANMMLYHIDSLDICLDEIHRVLKPNGVFYCSTFGENNINSYLYTKFSKFNFMININNTFTLQNGLRKLSPKFSKVIKKEYRDHLEVNNTKDIISYTLSLINNSSVDNSVIKEMERILDLEKRDGIIVIPKQYGMFTCYY